MQILFFCPRWGSSHIDWEDWLPQVMDAGYDGIEWGIGSIDSIAECDKVFNLCSRLNIPVISQHYETNDANIAAHLENYEKWWQKISQYPALKINTQTGKDYFTIAENQQLIELASSYAIKMGVPVVHETHRGKFSFAAHVTRQYLELLPNLRITLDASHWVNVAESLLEDQWETMALAISRTDHLHARIGYTEGPQVHDPRVNDFEESKSAHFTWWDTLVEQKKQKSETLTITPEFGPYPYMVHHPISKEPLSAQWDVNVYMMQQLRERYKGIL